MNRAKLPIQRRLSLLRPLKFSLSDVRAALTVAIHALRTAALVTVVVVLPCPLFLPGLLITLCCVSVGVAIALAMLAQSALASAAPLATALLRQTLVRVLARLGIARTGSSSGPTRVPADALEDLYNHLYRATQPGGPAVAADVQERRVLSIATTGRFNDMPLNTA